MRIALAFVIASLSSSAIAGVDPITITLGDTTSNPGDTVEVPITLNSGADAPEVIILFVKYNTAKLAPFNDYFEFELRDLAGNVIRDNDGNAIVRRSAVKPGQALEDAEKVADVEVHEEEGVVGISMAGLNGTPIEDGLLATLAFRVLPAAMPNETLALGGVDDTDPVLIFNESANNFEVTFSTASFNEFDQDATNLPVDIVDGTVQLGCAPLPAAPVNVTATQGGANSVTVSWAAGDGAGVEYRVYRSTENNVATALPLGANWISATTFEDVTAAAPVVVDEGGCGESPTSEVVRYYYWVKARSVFGCESAFSAQSAIGWRGEAKAQVNAAGMAPVGARGRGEALVFAALMVAMILGAGQRRAKSSV